MTTAERTHVGAAGTDRAAGRAPDHHRAGPRTRSAGETAQEALPLGPALLFCPGDRPDRFAKAADRADAVILDLEDAVAPERKQDAREAVAAHRLDPARTIVRVNPPGGPDFTADVTALAPLRPRWVMLPKAGTPAEVGRLVAALPSAKVLVLQDPTTAVDSVTEQTIADRLSQQRTGKITVVFSEAPAWRAVADHHRSTDELRAVTDELSGAVA